MLYRTMKERMLDDEFGIEDIEFESNYRDFEHNRMYLPEYRKESTMCPLIPVNITDLDPQKNRKGSPMTEVEKFAKELRELAAKAPPTVLVMPSNTVDIPEGSFIPQTLLLYIADCLDGKVN